MEAVMDEENDDVIEQVLLEEDCPDCSATGKQDVGACRICFGSGLVCTEFASAVLYLAYFPDARRMLRGEQVVDPMVPADALSVLVSLSGRTELYDFVVERLSLERDWHAKHLLETSEPLNLWTFKVNRDRSADRLAFGDWLKFFEYDLPLFFGGRWMTRSPQSLKAYEELTIQHDFMLCYQTNDRAIHGVARLMHKIEDEIILEPTVRFETPVKIHDLKTAHPWLDDVPAFAPSSRGTLFMMSTHDARRVLELCFEVQA